MAQLTSTDIIFANLTNTDTDLVPAGTIMMSAYDNGNTGFFGFLKANGQAISRTTYATLFSRIGTTYGAGDGSTTFNLPNFTGLFFRGWDNTRGLDPGRGLGSFQDSQIVSHGHNFSDRTSDHSHSGNTGWQSNNHSHWFLHTENSNRQSDGGGPASNEGAFGANTGGANDNHFHGFGTGNVSDDHTHNIGADGGGESRPRNVALVAYIKV